VADLREQLQSGLADRYVIERELGRGGMATVYLARDLRHDRPVALKVLHAELANTLGPERFQREIQLAARLQHPHILTVLDSGEAAVPGGARLWFTMPFVEGESLRDRLRRERQLPVEDAVRIAREAAQALQYAHRHGVVHRDIKPENMLLTAEGHTLVADFGIARALGAEPDQERLTETGLTLGTPAYMSPEQASGARELDSRTDIYSLGAVLYEMLAGEPPFTGATPQALLARRVLEDAPPLRQQRPSTPEAVERAVAKALARTPADRFGSAADFARALEIRDAPPPAGATTAVSAAPAAARTPRRVPSALAFVLGLLVTATMGMLLWRQAHRADPAGADGSRVVAVLPFENLGGADQEYFADGVTDAIRGKLAAIQGLQVIARSSSSAYRGSGKSPSQIADELGAQYLLTGTVRWERDASGNRVQVSPELVQIRSGGAPTTQWQQPFNAGITDVFQVQADIAKQVAEALDLQLGESQRVVLSERPTANLAAYDAYLRGEELYDRGGADPVSTRTAIEAYERAVALDTGFVLAWAKLSRAYSQLYGNGGASADVAERARGAAQRALALAPGRPEALLALGDYYSYVPSDNTKALEQYALAQRTAPNHAEILSGAALSELSLGRWEESLAHFRHALALDPRSPRTAVRTARTLLWLRRYPEALAAADRAVALGPGVATIFENKVMVALAQGDLAEGRRILAAPPAGMDPTNLVTAMAQFWDLFWVLDEAQQRLLLLLPPSAFGESREGWGLALAGTYALRGDLAHSRAYADSARIALEEKLAAQEDAQLHVLLGTALAYLGRREEAVREGRRAVAMLPLSKDAFSGAYVQHQLARIYILVGQPDQALEQLEPLLRAPYFLSPGWLRIDPTFDPLRKHPRFQRLLAGTA
jgi:TolB-like protein/Flp pilus assembly protein TadD